MLKFLHIVCVDIMITLFKRNKKKKNSRPNIKNIMVRTFWTEKVQFSLSGTAVANRKLGHPHKTWPKPKNIEKTWLKSSVGGETDSNWNGRDENVCCLCVAQGCLVELEERHTHSFRCLRDGNSIPLFIFWNFCVFHFKE